jgi:hypothetical protein
MQDIILSYNNRIKKKYIVIIYIMPGSKCGGRKRRVGRPRKVHHIGGSKCGGRRRRVHRRRGAGLFDTIKSYGSKINDFLRNGKYISKGANFLASQLPGQYGAVSSKVGSIADSLGYGRMPMYHRRRHMHHMIRY